MKRWADDRTRATLHSPSMSADRRAARNTLLVFGAVALLVLGAVTLAVAGGDRVQEPSPRDTVRDFLVTTVVNSDGVDACGYLTASAIRSLSSVEPRDTTCHEALSDTQLTLGGAHVDTEGEVKDLDTRVTQDGSRADVTLSSHGAAMTFALRRATAAETRAAGAAPTPWRIDSSVAGLVARVDPAAG